MDESIFSNLKGIIWDLDNTLYRLDDAMAHAFNLSVARAAIAGGGLDMTFEEAASIAAKSYEDHGYSGRVFIEEYGISRNHLHFEYYGYLDETVIEKSKKVNELFTELDLHHTLVTHSPMGWAERVLEHLELRKFFPDDHIFPFESYDFKPKSEDRKAFNTAINKLSFPVEEVAVVEDLIPNLRIPHEMGINTILIHHGKVPDSIPDYVAYACNNVLEVLQKVKDTQNDQAAPSSASG
jgi:putative hydrolase of the HAD superfamily